MQKSQQPAKPRTTEHAEPDAQPDDVRDAQLAEDVECCLAEIDDVLAAEAAEDERAAAEFTALAERYENGDEDAYSELRLWSAKYAHRGLKLGFCCGAPFMYTEK
jgi:hypothetical protein